MRTISRWSVMVLPLALAVGVVLAGAPGVLAQEEAFDRIADEAATIRELPPPAEITERFVTPAELRADLPALIEEDLPAAEAAAATRSAVALGLLPLGSDLATLYLDLLAEQVGGYYDPEANEMVVVGDGDAAELDALEEIAYFHETIHALQDQHLGLGDLILDETEPEPTDDEVLALTALFEGDAMTAEIEYLAAHPGLTIRYALAAAQQVGGMEQLGSAPPVLIATLFFPYLQGQSFVAAIQAAGGWAAVDVAYADPPVSTEQVLHPEKYLERDEPTPVVLPDLGAALGAGWSLVDENALGELQTGILLAGLEPGDGFDALTGTIELPESATAAAAGWDGDRYALWANGEQEVLILRTAWDGEEDAAEFARALQQREAIRFGGDWTGEEGERVALDSAERAARIERTGTAVGYVVAPTAELAEAALAVRPAA